MISHPSQGRSEKPSLASEHAFEVLVRFAALMWRSGNTAIRTRECMDLMARKLGFDDVVLSLSLEAVTIGACRARVWTTATRSPGPPAVNTRRIAELEQLAKAAGPGDGARDLESKLAEIESRPPLYSTAQIAGAIALASAGFAFLNGAGPVEMTATAIGGGFGHWSRVLLSHRGLSQYGVVALAAATASGTYVLAAAFADLLGLGFPHYPIGFLASVLFLVPGVPLISALFDLLQLQTVAALSRLAHAAVILLAAAFGLGIVIAIAGVDLSRPPPIAIAYPLKLLLRAAASFVAASAFALSFNSTPRTVLAVGLLALGANSLRLILIDIGSMPAPAAFFAALAIGLSALAMDWRFNVPPIASTVAPIIIMIPGLSAFEAIVLFNSGEVLEALRAAAMCGFVIGALAIGLASARLFGR